VSEPTVLARIRAVREPRHFGKVLVGLSLIPALVALVALASDITRGTRLFGSNPIKEGEHFLGEWTLRFLILTLAVTPLRQIFKWNWIAKHRRTMGLFAFAYGVLHWLVYVLLDVQLDVREIVTDVAKRPYILVGTLSLLLMLPLALTSTSKMIGRLGGRNWNRLHKLVYASAVLGVVHFWMSVKSDIEDPLIFAAIFAVLFAYRIWKWRSSPATAPSL
jgi:methionine sulfoxide reductase heme-binding subunit